MKQIVLLSILLLTLPAVLIKAQQVVKINNDSHDLFLQYKSAFDYMDKSENFWMGYSICTDSDHQFLVGSYFINDRNNVISLRDIILNTQKFKDFSSHRNKTKRNKIYGRTYRINNISVNDNVTDKETAVLFLYDKNPKSIYDIEEVVVCNLSLYVDLYNCPVLWLGEQDNKSSVDFVINLFKQSKDDFSKKELIPAVGIHTSQEAATSFLKNIIDSKADNDVRKNSVLWLGFQNNSDAFTEIKNLIKDDHSLEIRKNAVMSLSFMKLPEATNELIDVAKHNNEHELRKQAVYGLGNKAVKKAEEALKNIVEDDPDIEIKKHAVYALANSSDNPIPYLIKLAKTNPNISIRKCAIWSLGNSNDERAIDALISLAKNK